MTDGRRPSDGKCDHYDVGPKHSWRNAGIFSPYVSWAKRHLRRLDRRTWKKEAKDSIGNDE